MKITFTLIIVLLLSKAWGQHLKDSHSKIISKDNFEFFIDSLKKSITNDTTKFSRNDLVHNAIGTVNLKHYSNLYLINGKYMYKLDIISADKVLEFINEYFDAEKIDGITISDSIYSQQFYGLNGIPGLISIKLKNGIKFNPKVAGLLMIGKIGNNFEQRQNEELKIRE